MRSVADVGKNFTHLAVPHGHCFLLQIQGLQKFLYGLWGGRRDELKVRLTACQDAGERSKTGARGSPTGRGKCGRGAYPKSLPHTAHSTGTSTRPKCFISTSRPSHRRPKTQEVMMRVAGAENRISVCDKVAVNCAHLA